MHVSQPQAAVVDEPVLVMPPPVDGPPITETSAESACILDQTTQEHASVTEPVENTLLHLPVPQEESDEAFLATSIQKLRDLVASL